MKRTLAYLFSQIVPLTIIGLLSVPAYASTLSLQLFADLEPAERSLALGAGNATSFNGQVFFSAVSENAGIEVWHKMPNGAPALFAETAPGPDNGWPAQFNVMGDTLYFIANDEQGNRRLWAVNQDNQLTQIDVSPDGTALDVSTYFRDGDVLYVLANERRVNGSVNQLYRLEGQQWSVVDDTLSTEFSYVEVANLFEFDGALFMYLNTDTEVEDCLLRRYDRPFSAEQSTDIPCDSLSYFHQVEIIGDRAYLPGKTHLMVFDGQSEPTPVLNGSGPTGRIAAIGDALFVATVGINSGPDTLPYLYRFMNGEIIRVTEPATTPTSYDEDAAVTDIWIEADEDLLYVTTMTSKNDGEEWFSYGVERFTVTPDIATTEIVNRSSIDTDTLSSINVLSDDEAGDCADMLFNYVLCQTSSGALAIPTVPFGEGSAPSNLTTLGDNLYFQARVNLQRTWWKSTPDGQNTLVTEQDFNSAHAWQDQLYFQDWRHELHRLGSDGSIVSLTDTVGGFPQDLSYIFFTDERILLVQREGSNYVLWAFDGETPPNRLTEISRETENLIFKPTPGGLFIESTPAYGQVDAARCGVLQLRDDQIEPVLLSTEEGIENCNSSLLSFDGRTFVYIGVTKDEQYSSSLAEISMGQPTWWWQNEALQVFAHDAFIARDDGLYFCGKDDASGQPFFNMIKRSPTGEMQSIDNTCAEDAIVSDVSGSEEVYLLIDRTNGLFQLGQDAFERVNAVNTFGLGEVTDITPFVDSLVLSAGFGVGNESYGQELVRLSITNQQVSFVQSTEQTLDMQAEADPVPLGQSLAVTDLDEGDTIRWTVETPPQSGTLNGLPLEMASDGQTLYPDQISYTPDEGFSGTDTFVVKVSDGFTQALMSVSVTVAAAATPPAPAPTTPERDTGSSGGSLGWWLLGAAIVLFRRRRGLGLTKPTD